MKRLINIAFLAILTSCTYSINQVSTKGTASDVIDENQTASPEVTADLPHLLAAGSPETFPCS